MMSSEDPNGFQIKTYWKRKVLAETSFEPKSQKVKLCCQTFAFKSKAFDRDIVTKAG